MPRYIDADKILDKMRNVMDMQDLYLPMHFIDLVIDEMPAADIREVVHGEWLQMNEVDIDGNAQYQCSVCHAGDLHVPSVEVPFCWKCGAKMGGRDKDA